jgi:DNA polymerase-3 subunit beta
MKMKTEISVNYLTAALVIAPKSDIRYYLNGVNMAFKHGEESSVLEVVSTDGHMLFKAVQTLKYSEDTQTADFSMIIPRDVVDTAVRTAKRVKRSTITLEALPDGRYMLGETVFATIDGKYPDYERIVPKSCSGELAQFNLQYLAQADTALRVAYENKSIHVHLSHNGKECAVVHTGLRNAFVVVMPLRSEISTWSN